MKKSKILALSLLAAMAVGVATGCGPKEPPHEHDFEIQFDANKHWEECECGEKQGEEAHTWNDGVVTTPATCTETGLMTFTCTVCGQTKTEVISKASHTFDFDEAEYVWSDDKMECTAKLECTVCGAEVEIPGVVTKTETPATCYRAGSTKFTATFEGYDDLGDVKTTALPTTDHNPASAWTSDADKHWHACQNEGCTEHIGEAAHTFVNGKCSVCGYERVYTSIASLVANGEGAKRYNTIGKVVATYTRDTKNGIYIADGNRAIQLYDFKNRSDIKVGDMVEVLNTSFDANYTELKCDDNSVLTVITTLPAHVNIAEPVPYVYDAESWEKITTAQNENYSRPITVSGVLTAVPDDMSSSKYRTLSMKLSDDKVITIYLRGNALSSEVDEKLAKFVNGMKVQLSGVITQNKGTPQIVCLSDVEFLDVASIKVGTTVTLFDSLQEAVDSITTSDEAVITLLRDVEEGAGVKVPSGRNIVFDFAGHTYTVAGPTVGSTGTQTLGFQLLKDSTVKFMNGTIDCYDFTGVAEEELTGKKVKILIQNYAKLTLEEMTIDHSKGVNALYAVSNNFGYLKLDKLSKIIAADGQKAFDVYYGMQAQYMDGVIVYIPEDMPVDSIVGKIEYGYKPADPADNWYEKAFFNIGGKKYTVKDVNVDGTEKTRSFDSFADLVAKTDNAFDNLEEIVINATSIEIKAGSTQRTSYVVGEIPNTKGLTLVAHYESLDDEEISVGFTTDLPTTAFTSADVGAKVVTVSYAGQTVTYNITVASDTLTPEEANAVAKLLQADACTTAKVKVSGNVSSFQGAYQEGGYRTLFITIDGINILQVSQLVYDNADAVKLGDFITVEGYLRNNSWGYDMHYNDDGIKPVLKSVDPSKFSDDLISVVNTVAALGNLEDITSVPTEDVTLPAGVKSGDKTATVTYALKEASEHASIVNNKLHVVSVPAEKVTLTLVATVNSGDFTQTKEITVGLKQLSDEGINIEILPEYFPTSYNKDNTKYKTINSIDYVYLNVIKNNDKPSKGLQFAKNSTTIVGETKGSMIYNAVAYSKDIAKIIINVNANTTKTGDLFIVTFSKTSDFTGTDDIVAYANNPTASTAASLEITCTGTGYRYCKIENNISNALYCDSIVINIK